MAVTGILGKKIGMTQVFDEKGDVHPITVLQAGLRDYAVERRWQGRLRGRRLAWWSSSRTRT